LNDRHAVEEAVRRFLEGLLHERQASGELDLRRLEAAHVSGDRATADLDSSVTWTLDHPEHGRSSRTEKLTGPVELERDGEAWRVVDVMVDGRPRQSSRTKVQGFVELGDLRCEDLVVELAAHHTGRRRVVELPTRVVHPDVSTTDLAKQYPAFITIDRSTFTLRLFRDLRFYKSYRIAVGRQGLETPAGEYEINDRQVNPSWHVPNSPWAGSLAGQIIPPGPADPIKARWLGFYNGAGIHGTDDIGSLGTAASHGCIRMSIPDVEQLYPQVPLHTPIYVG